LSDFHKKGKKADGTIAYNSHCKACKKLKDVKHWKNRLLNEGMKDGRPWWPEDHLPDNVVKLSRMAWV
jgi:hypothetical protein